MRAVTLWDHSAVSRAMRASPTPIESTSSLRKRAGYVNSKEILRSTQFGNMEMLRLFIRHAGNGWGLAEQGDVDRELLGDGGHLGASCGVSFLRLI